MRYSVCAGCSLIMGVLLLFGAAACRKNEAKVVEEKTFNVQVQAAEKRPLRPFIEAIGTLNANEEVTVSAQVEGVLHSVKIDEGVVVSKGSPIVLIDDTDYNHEVRRDEAALKQVEATLANTRIELKRKEALYKEELVTQQQFDDVSTRLSLAEAEVDRLRALLSLAKQKLARTRITAPISGVVKERKVSAGDFVKNGTPLCVIIQSNPLKLQFSVPEKDVSKLKLGQDITVKVDAYRDRDFTGRVSIIYPHVEEKTRTLLVEALVPNGQGLLKPGLFARVVLYTGGERDTVVIPITAVLYEGEQTKVFVANADRAQSRMVKLGNKYGEAMEVSEGVSAGDKVIVAGQQNLSQGAKLKIAAPVEPAQREPAPGKQGKP